MWSETKTQRNYFMYMFHLKSFQDSKSLGSGRLYKQNNQAKPHNLYILNNFYLYTLVFCVLIMGLGKSTSHIFYSVIFEYFSSAPWGGTGDGDVQMTQG